MKKYFGIFVVTFILITTIILGACSSKNEKLEQTYEAGEAVSAEEAKTIAEDFINEFLMMDETSVSAELKGEAYGLYHFTIDIGAENPVESFITKDGRLFFPQALDIEEIKAESNLDGSEEELNIDEINLPQTNKPVIEMFIMTYCPYGTQIQKGILPVLEVLGDKVDFQQKYVDYAMHDKEELDENLLQYCLQEDNPDEFISYLECFLATGESSPCFDTIVSNQSAVNTCIEDTDKEYKVTENYTNKVDWRGNFPGFNVNKEDVTKYNVGGSPTLVINGQETQAWRDPASLLKIICSAFIEQPEACQTQLPSTAPAPGFGLENTGVNTDASCE
jgi:hypothetical protein